MSCPACLHLRGRQCGAGAYIHASRPPERRGRAGREGGGNKTIDLEDVSSASKGSVIDVHTYLTGELTRLFCLEML